MHILTLRPFLPPSLPQVKALLLLRLELPFPGTLRIRPCAPPSSLNPHYSLLYSQTPFAPELVLFHGTT